MIPKSAKRPKMDTDAAIKRLAYRIARDLMTSGGGGKIRAERLELMDKDGRDLGGWELRPLVRCIAMHLRGEEPTS